MWRHWIIILTCMLIFSVVFACAGIPKFNFPQGTRVGIINLLESEATHTNFSNFGQNNFTKTYPVDWQIPAYAEHKLTAQLKKNPNLTTVEIKVSDPAKKDALRLNLIERVVLSQTAPPTIPPEGAKLLETISSPEDVQVIVIIGSYSGPSPYKSTDTTISLEGYGLFTRSLFRGIFGSFLSFRKAYAFAQIGVVVYRVQPVIYLGSTKTSSVGRPLLPLSDFDWKADMKNLPKSEIDKAKPRIEQYIVEAVEQALKISNLSTSGISPDSAGSDVGGTPAP